MKNVSGVFCALGLVSMITLTGCGSEDSKDKDSAGSEETGICDSSNTVPYSVDCSCASAYKPTKAPVVTLAASGTASTSIIFMHGKSGSPLYTGYVAMAQNLAASNYDVIAPYMPWSGTTWSGTMCQGMLYINQLAQAEIDKGRHVVVMGHSMGGAHALLHGIISPNVAIDAYVSIAPGHFPQKSKSIQDTAAPGIVAANDLISKNMGYHFATYDIINGGTVSQISATAYTFLSFHDVSLFPDVDQALPVLTRPVLWLGGDADSLTTSYNYPLFSANIVAANSEYHTISGDHYTVLGSVPAATQPWISGLGF